jgi:hypothetical protein
MLAEDYSYTGNAPSLSNQGGRTIYFILECLKKTCSPFLKASSQNNLYFPLNENRLTQIFVEQIEVFIKSHPNIGVKNQYSDTFYGTKGIPDFYFHKIEEGVHNEPLMVWEAKILSNSLGKKREKEYVIGENNNGGIERFKTEMHGKGIDNCGLIGYVQKDEPNHWLKKINNWITDLATLHKSWKADEILSELDSNTDYCFLESIAHRKTNDIKLSHLWIILN